MNASILPLPTLSARKVGSLDILTDDALARTLGVRVVFTGVSGGVSEGAFSSLNLATHVGDTLSSVLENRRRLMGSLAAEDIPLIVPNQVHGSDIVVVSSAASVSVDEAQAQAARGADAVVVETPELAALLCFADCVPVIVVSPSGRFAVVHAGWRGVVARIASKAVDEIARLDAHEGLFCDVGGYNVYVGPHIRSECFECGEDVRNRFVELFGEGCATDTRHVDLLAALSVDLRRAGIESARIADAGICTVCNSDRFYSYRASGGSCGRHGALAFRRV